MWSITFDSANKLTRSPSLSMRFSTESLKVWTIVVFLQKWWQKMFVDKLFFPHDYDETTSRSLNDNMQYRWWKKTIINVVSNKILPKNLSLVLLHSCLRLPDVRSLNPPVRAFLFKGYIFYPVFYLIFPICLTRNWQGRLNMIKKKD